MLAILKTYGEDTFKKEFTFSYAGDKSNPSDKLSTGHALVKGKEALCHRRTKDTATFNALVHTMILEYVF